MVLEPLSHITTDSHALQILRPLAVIRGTRDDCLGICSQISTNVREAWRRTTYGRLCIRLRVALAVVDVDLLMWDMSDLFP